LDGTDIREMDLAHLRQSIGVVLQENFLFHGTVRENISMTKPDASFDAVVEAAKMAGADEFIQYLPQGYDTVLEENGSNLSGGQRQRLAIARALLKQPRILIFDEATSALDPESEYIIQQNLERIAEGRTMILVAHRLSTLRNADRIIVLEKGRINAVGSHDELIDPSHPNHSSIYKELWDLQSRYSR
ncbi:MAG: ATP-binding cassette domain-containing protein, partial [Gammaproteobacteria bacterium]|nr:ATP-binding cassette domain-containing protein [Gammaproteobacteria bacterium]MBU1654195.1 ATP-binding cassette domain-containing protein [Gammaproteobacteria bacterium]MBU1959669.1 ATP-binding cassette domain-containing protein [Gammaproteobacteria bacterium]